MKRNLAKIVLTLVAASLFAATGAAQAADRLNVVCTLTDLGWLAQQVGGDDAQVEVLCPGAYDPHFLPARPSLARTLGKADLLCYNGLDLEVGWLPVLMDKARNPRVRGGEPGDLDCSRAVDRVLEVPAGAVSRAEGDVHPYGNPHYLLDPRNGVKVAHLMAERMAQLRPEAADRFRRRADDLDADLAPRIRAWHDAASVAGAHPLVIHTKQWEYLADWLGLQLLDAVENRPGIAPSPKHVDELIGRATAAGVVELIAAPWNHLDAAGKAASRMNAALVVLPAAVDSQPDTGTYPAMFDVIAARLAAGAKGAQR
ncbi:MAG TPA: metal ABC transporter substrate-binding protein [Candidatus Krumholzibacteria bacterium]|nr:metal ABC transporter substrate-binding protein [Candidatus Krumholzibacteria bacterium]